MKKLADMIDKRLKMRTDKLIETGVEAFDGTPFRNEECRMTNDELWSRCAPSIHKFTIDRIPLSRIAAKIIPDMDMK